MEYGKLANIDDVNWDLPVTDPLSRAFLQKNKSDKKSQIYIGAPAWGRKEWVGSLYPPKTPASDFLFHYAKTFNCIELNTTHYRVPTAENIKTWMSKVSDDFLFCPKVPQNISHRTHGLRDRSQLEEWWKCLSQFGPHLGPCFLQLPPYFSYESKSELFHFLKSWPDEFELSLELRHTSWFKAGAVLPGLVEYLQSRDIGLVITDVAGHREVLHGSLSSSFSMLRFIGNDLHPSDYSRCKRWSEKIHEWQGLGLQKFFFMVHEPDDIKTPEMTRQVIQDLNETCGSNFKNLFFV